MVHAASTATLFLRHFGRATLAAGLVLAACACAAWLCTSGPSASPTRGNPEDGVMLDAMDTIGKAAGEVADLGSNLVQGVDETHHLLSDLPPDANASLPHINGLLTKMKGAKSWLGERLGEQVALMRGQNIALPSRSSMKAGPVVPGNDLADGNPCADDEEMKGDLCYKKCSILTKGKYPRRTTAFSCCRAEPCGLLDQDVRMEVCRGYDVSGDSQGGGCPHRAGACLGNEELLGGMCFKKCSLLTNFTRPFRMAAATCCKVNNIAACIVNPALGTTSAHFNVGGGGTDGNLSSLSEPHLPVVAFTEGLPKLPVQDPVVGPGDGGVPPTEDAHSDVGNSTPSDGGNSTPLPTHGNHSGTEDGLAWRDVDHPGHPGREELAGTGIFHPSKEETAALVAEAVGTEAGEATEPIVLAAPDTPGSTDESPVSAGGASTTEVLAIR